MGVCKFCKIFKSKLNIKTMSIDEEEYEYIVCTYHTEEKIVPVEECLNCKLKDVIDD
jgi:hypothetical protein